jgi:D-3-phosphoglycerate dehydrogenase
VTYRVLVTDYRWPDLSVERAVLEPAGIELVVARTGELDELRRLAADVDAIMTCFKLVDASVLRAASRCRTVARYGVGLDNIDVACATGLGMVVTNVPDYCRDEVADHALLLILGLARRIGPAIGSDAPPATPVRLRGKTIGLVGLGSIASALVPRAQALGLEVIAYSRRGHSALPVRIVTDLEALLGLSDIVSLHVPATPGTHHLVDARRLRLMKPGAFLINTARGSLVDTAALVEALEQGQIAGAGLDVTEPEPLPADHPLRTHPNVLLTPHMAFYSDGSVEELAATAARNVLDVLQGRCPAHVVNPSVTSR